jgi:hypothetical protein
VVPALLRAAVHRKAVIGFCLAAESTDPVALKRSHSPGGFFRAVVDAAAQVERVPPFLLHVEAPRVDRPEGSDYEAACNYLARCLEAGFTSFGIDLTGCEPQDCPSVAVGLLAGALDLELCVTVRLGAERAADLAAGVEALKREGIHPDLVILPGPDELGDEAWRLAVEVAPLIAPTSLGWRDPGKDEPLVAAKLRAAFIRCLVGGTRLYESQEGDAEKAEALAYMEAIELLTKLGGQDSAQLLCEAVARSLGES